MLNLLVNKGKAHSSLEVICCPSRTFWFCPWKTSQSADQTLEPPQPSAFNTKKQQLQFVLSPNHSFSQYVRSAIIHWKCILFNWIWDCLFCYSYISHSAVTMKMPYFVLFWSPVVFLSEFSHRCEFFQISYWIMNTDPKRGTAVCSSLDVVLDTFVTSCSTLPSSRKVYHYFMLSPFAENGSHCGLPESQTLKRWLVRKSFKNGFSNLCTSGTLLLVSSWITLAQGWCVAFWDVVVYFILSDSIAYRACRSESQWEVIHDLTREAWGLVSLCHFLLIN